MNEREPAATHGSGFRADIQALRAIAVLAVLAFHLRPRWMPGGYVGVDVFFVISGFLITGLLVRELERSGRIDLMAFYGRRIRRLIPAASAVLLTVAVLTPFVLSPAIWETTYLDVVASAFNVENWRLAASSVDYLAADGSASPMQHYWSLSVEEQFYLLWPCLMLVAVLVGRRLGLAVRAALTTSLALVTLGSFAAALVLTRMGAPEAYFVTHTRVWELGLGGLLAMSAWRLPARWGYAAALAGLAMIAAAIMLLDERSSVPGFDALLPTLGAALFLLGGRSAQLPFLGLGPVQHIGDLSYSIYLWHWPLIIFAKELFGETLTTVTVAVLLVLTLVVAQLSKTFIEDRFQGKSHERLVIPRLRWVLGMALGPVAVSTALLLGVDAAASAAAADLAKRHPGARVLFSDVAAPAATDYYPPLTRVKKDIAAAYDNGCHASRQAEEATACEYGMPDGDLHIALVGDSHATNWIPALDTAAKARNWRITVFTKSACTLLDRKVMEVGRPYDACLAWGSDVLRKLRELSPDVTIMTQRRGVRLWQDGHGASSIEAMTEALMAFWGSLDASAGRLIVIRDTPAMPFDPPECMSEAADCSVSAEKVLTADPLLMAASASPKVGLIDMTDGFCIEGNCPPVIGNVLVWRDSHHFTATYSASLADELAERIDGLLPGSQR